MKMFRYLSVGLAAILCFVGTKMLISEWYHILIGVSLGIVSGVLALAVLGSLLISKLENGRVVAQPAVDNERVEVEA